MGPFLYLKLRLIVDSRHVVESLCDVGQPVLQLFCFALAVLQRQFLLDLSLTSHLSFCRQNKQRDRSERVVRIPILFVSIYLSSRGF